MKILSADLMRLADAHTIATEPITSTELMERASQKCATEILMRYKNGNFLVVCGTGNNGGDGLAIARMLVQAGREANVFVVGDTEKATADFTIQFQRLQKTDATILETDKQPMWENYNVIVDALIGAGLKRPVKGEMAEVIASINRSPAAKVSIDMPSGLFMEDNSQNNGAVITADFILTFHCPKIALLLAENGSYCKAFKVLDIGLSGEFTEQVNSNFSYYTLSEAREDHRPRHRFTHKGETGHALVMAGSKGKMGAAFLAAKGCLTAGAGLITLYIPNCGYTMVQTGIPEAMTITDPQEEYITHLPEIKPYKVLAVGPGIGMHPDTSKVIDRLLGQTNIPLVLDADALNILSTHTEMLEKLPQGSILTPHPGEFDRLAGRSGTGWERLQRAIEFAGRFKVHVVLKGAYTAVIEPNGNVCFNSIGNAGMATGGSGDVLTGVIAGLLAQGYMPIQAARFGVWLHGMAGDAAVEKFCMESVSASDIASNLYAGYRTLGTFV